MINILKWALLIIAATAAMDAGMYCFAQYLDSKEPDGSDTDKKYFHSVSKSFTRHYTKLNL